MLRKESAPKEGLHQEASETAGTESSDCASSPLGGGAGSATVESGDQAPNTSSTATLAEYRSDDEPERDPAHVCKQWPCPQCHKPRDAPDEETTVEARQYSAEAASSTQSFFEPSLQLKPTEDSDDDDDDDLLLDIVGPSAAHVIQSHKRHCS